MNAKKFSDAMSELDSKYIDEAINYKKKVKKSRKKANKHSLIKWGAMAACLCLIVAGAFTLPHFIGNDIPSTPPVVEENVYGFTMEGSDVLYFPISFSQRKTFGLIDENATGLTDENTYQITDDDLGDIMGIVGDSQDESIIGETVYHFIKFSSDDAICIVKVNGIYQFYVKEGVEGIEKTPNPDIIIDAPVDENTYHEAEPNAPTEYETEEPQQEQIETPSAESNSPTSPAAETVNEAITLDYITELQSKISTAMSNGELPFVSYSAVYENPYRLHIVVSSNSETDLSKLKAFDTIGGALEIEYDTNQISVEDVLTE
ncbi:hypothetical protein [Pseudoflavonifractor phocaeensis]|uniref:hypothetical protein n=1 Tax=Pseudoflavonifractor phocaeensis TaxID=1870988 RepID=UPI00195D0F06|nr:hypothetical protein [Pseudoflavonifractor phocaeensis]MBM6725304.1 hypothetical protein [Pseudoflavonifractor phocaeensis]